MRRILLSPTKSAWVVATMVALGCFVSAAAQTAAATGAASSEQQPVTLDSVIAVINGDVLLRSDLQSEMEMAALQPLSLPAGKDLLRRAAQRLINRTLIQQQMESQGLVKAVSDEDVKGDLDLLRKQIPDCVAYQCETDAGWAKFLRVHNLTATEVQANWRLRMQLLAFIDLRFRGGIKITKPEIEEYYNKTLVPLFKAKNLPAPSIDTMSNRIEEVLLQERVNVLLQDWIKSLRDQGNVIILDPALGKSNPSPDDGENGDGA